MNKQNNKSQIKDDKRLFIAVIICIILVIASFIGNILIIDYSFGKLNVEYQKYFNQIQFRIREVNLRVQNNPKNEKEIEMLNEINENHR